ncbi:hypothetical protein SEA_ARCHETTA_71 [Mycobacterium phage Archetta]|uniref:Uncharacterized protein n=3 Tax=Benedictvirus TaxID=2946819 RepID=A0A5Q2WEV5_9CAUD|nr:hypothetical protein KIP50_gp19 [Mycobacterium phage Zolita]YP_010060950.1 hypothetical protein KIP51_gp19 [Mycobacterium phage Bluefalcon]YP_010061034.1 hypothetical protein KIP52_gp11 [Mycobacterium phage Archetta]UVK64291.1 hypothetical protein SEA_SYDNAT_73 [Mycobacterium phage SydNat]UVK64379.1 hypothetical protein SEA_GHOULBOY_73 [Mycobacterium phage Ghoulboy]ATW60942.1 hypothetical protein SEA_ARCHETTA_71 [Mycobacterium phage Archetta]QDK03155.1 hypothetical protein SEA_ZOLITA_72 [M
MIEIYVNGGTSEEIATMLHEVADDIKRGYIPVDDFFRTKLWARNAQIGTIRTIPATAFD